MANSVTSLTMLRRIDSRASGHAQSNGVPPASLDQVRQDTTTNNTIADDTQRQISNEKEAKRAKRIEKVAKAVVVVVDRKMSTENGREDLATQVDGRERGTRTTRQELTKNRFISRLSTKREQKKTNVVVVKPGEEKTVVTNTGEHKVAKLEKNEKSKVIEAQDGSSVVVLNSNLSDQDAVMAAVKFEVNEIKDTANQVNFEVQTNFDRDFMKSTFWTLREVFSINVWLDQASFTDTPEEARLDEQIVEENNLAQQRIRNHAEGSNQKIE